MLIPIGFLAASGAGAAGSYDLLATTILSSSQASVTFSSLDSYSGYQHLQIRAVAGNTNSGTDMDNMFLRFNSDSGSNYAHHRLWGSGSSVSSYSATSQTYMLGGIYTRGSSTSFAASVIDILDPFEAKNKTVRSLIGGTNTSQNVIGLNSGLWMNTASLSSIVLFCSSDSFRSGSRFSLYGLRSA